MVVGSRICYSYSFHEIIIAHKLEHLNAPPPFSRFSEPVDTDKAKTAVTIKQGVDTISGTFSFEDSDQFMVFTPSSALPQNETLTVTVAVTLEDRFKNTLGTEFNESFTYAGAPVIIYDRTAPVVEEVRVYEDNLYVTFNECLAPVSLINSIELHSPQETITGTISYENSKILKFEPSIPLANGVEYTVMVTTAVQDLSSKALPEELTTQFTYKGTDLIIYEEPSEHEHDESLKQNTYLFQGRTYEPETGLYYYRHRYLHPELGRFLQTDPMGYHDSMNMYQAFNNNPTNYTDPMGENNVVVVTPSGSEMKTDLTLEEFWYFLRREYSPKDAAKILKQTKGYGNISDMRLFALEISGRESPITNTTLKQFIKDFGAGTINAGFEMMSTGFKILSGGNPGAVKDIDKIKSAIQGKVNNVIGANDGSLGYFFGTYWGPAVAGGYSAGRITAASQTQFTDDIWPYMDDLETNYHLIASKKGYKGIRLTNKGAPDFSSSKYLYKTIDGQKNIVKIKMTGKYYQDFKEANRLAGFKGARAPKGYTWHHLDDFNPATGECTMQLVTQDAHLATYTHRGSVYYYESYYGTEYK